MNANDRAELAAIRATLDEVRLAVIGDGSKDSSLRERVSALESGNDWKHRLVATAIPTVLGAVLAHLGVHVPAPQA